MSHLFSPRTSAGKGVATADEFANFNKLDSNFMFDHAVASTGIKVVVIISPLSRRAGFVRDELEKFDAFISERKDVQFSDVSLSVSTGPEVTTRFGVRGDSLLCLFLKDGREKARLTSWSSEKVFKTLDVIVNESVSGLQEINTLAEFQEVCGANANVVIEVYSPICGPCLNSVPKVIEAKKLLAGTWVFFAVDSNKVADDLYKALNYKRTPTFIVFKNGKEKARVEGGADTLATFVRAQE